jgi:hypothetical protein
MLPSCQQVLELKFEAEQLWHIEDILFDAFPDLHNRAHVVRRKYIFTPIFHTNTNSKIDLGSHKFSTMQAVHWRPCP